MLITDEARRHITQIDEAIQELIQFQARTIAPNPMTHQYIGTSIDSILPLLSAAANSLDSGNRNVQYSEFRNWISLMQLIHRSFFAMLHIAVELSIDTICEKHALDVASSAGKRNLERLEKIITDNTKEMNQLKKYVTTSPLN